MPRNMSFSHTITPMRRKLKTVTRRKGWLFLKPGDIVRAVEKAMGLNKGERVKPIGMIRILSVRREPFDLQHVSRSEVLKEGFDMPRKAFINWFRKKFRLREGDFVTRIEFEHIEG